MHAPSALIRERVFGALRFARAFKKNASILRNAASRLLGAALRFARGFKKELRLAASRLIGAIRFACGFKKELRLAALRLIASLRFAHGFKKELFYAAWRLFGALRFARAFKKRPPTMVISFFFSKIPPILKLEVGSSGHFASLVVSRKNALSK